MNARSRSLLCGFLAAAALFAIIPAAAAQEIRVVASCATGVSPAFDAGGSAGRLTIDTTGRLCSGGTGPTGFPAGSTPISGNAAGTTGAVTGTLAGTSGKTTYICGFAVSAIGGTAAVGPITIAGLVGSSQVYQGSSSAAGGIVASATFAPYCIPASAVNTAITVTTTANGTATAVNVNLWGFQL